MYFIHWLNDLGQRCTMDVNDMEIILLEVLFINEPSCWIDQDGKRYLYQSKI